MLKAFEMGKIIRPLENPKASNKPVFYAFKINDEYRELVGKLKKIRFAELNTEEDIINCVRTLRKESKTWMLTESGLIKEDPLNKWTRFQDRVSCDKKDIIIKERFDDKSFAYHFNQHKRCYLPMLGYAVVAADNFDEDRLKDEDLALCNDFVAKKNNNCYWTR